MEYNQYDVSKFLNLLSAFELSLNQMQIDKFMKYYELLIEWNQYINLTAITEFDEVCLKHFIDSLSLSKVVDCTKDDTIIDIGTGAGFPGIPLKIVFPNLKITLLDSLGKRVKFLNEIIEKLSLEKIEAIHGRAEDYAKSELYREKYDICVSRAVSNLSVLSEYCIPYVKVNGFFISYKSEKVSEEIKTAQRAVKVLGGKIYHQEEFILPNSDIYRNLIMIQKVEHTPQKYPRKAGIPSKEPIK